MAAMMSGLVTAPLAARAQPSAVKVVRVGVLRAAPDGGPFRQYFEFFRQALRESGLVEGRNLSLEYRVRAGSAEDVADMAAELVRLDVDVVVAFGSPAVRAAAGATRSMPIVALDLESDPLAEGFVTALARPGGNVTGLFLDLPELSGKWIEYLRAIVPRLSRIAVIWDPSTPSTLLRGAEAAGRAAGVEVFSLEARGPGEFTAGFRSAASRRAGAILILPSPATSSARRQIIELAAKQRMPTIMPFAEFAEEGGLIAYGPDVAGMYRQMADVMMKVLRGQRAADIPIERPAYFTLIVNRKTAASLGLTVPRSLLARADKVIE
ncbi:MAG TPA: ABC transporter substrate-binding protein [Methylomirabilota bacterium]|nr:ABC transporter substrate-binding protein [Methylomirabilota bacterium]